MSKKIIYWVLGIIVLLIVVGALGGGSSKTQVQGTNTIEPSSSQTYYTPTPTVDQSSNGLSNDNSYTNVDGNQVHSPAYSNNGEVPVGATARCGDGTYSFSQHRSGTCSHHGGVAQWL